MGGKTRDRDDCMEKEDGPVASGSLHRPRVSYAMTLQFDRAGRDEDKQPQVTPFSMNRPLVPPASEGGAPKGRDQIVMPPVQVRIGPEDITLVADMPGIRGEDIDICVLPGAIRILGESAEDAGPGDQGWSQKMGFVGSPRTRLFTGTAPPPGTRARLRDGILELRVPRRMVIQGKQPARIPVG